MRDASPEAHFEALFRRRPALEACRRDIWAAYELLRDCFANGGKLLLCGNGGSCADCDHIAGELMKSFMRPRPLPDESRRALREADPDGGAAVFGGAAADSTDYGNAAHDGAAADGRAEKSGAFCGNADRNGAVADGRIENSTVSGGVVLRGRAERNVASSYGDMLGTELQGTLRAVNLCGHQALSSAIANDMRPALIYAQQTLALGDAGDVLMGLSTSGQAENVYYALIAARAAGMKTVGLTGAGGGRMARLCDVAIRVPAEQTYEIQEYHLPVYHTLCAMLEARFF